MWIFWSVFGGLILIVLVLWITAYFTGRWAQDLAEALRNFKKFYI